MELGYEIKRASKEIIEMMMEIGAVYVDRDGMHASEPGIYPKENSTADR